MVTSPSIQSGLPVAREPDAGFLAVLRRLTQGRLTLADLWLLVPPLGLLAVLNLSFIRPNDFWWHLRTGQIIAQTGAIPSIDLFTFTRAGATWINQGWLTQAALYRIYQAGGLPLIIFVHALLITLGYWLVELACWRRSGDTRAAAGASVAAMSLGITNWNVRPQSVSFLLFGLTIFLLEGHRTRRSRLIWLLPLLCALWVNLHGGFVFGIGLVGIYVGGALVNSLLAGRRLRDVGPLAAAGGLAVLALALNPTGPAGIVGYVLGFFRSGTTQTLNVEFLPLSIRQPDGAAFFAVVTLLLVTTYTRRTRLAPLTLATLLIYGAVSLYSRRATPWFGMVAALAVADALAATHRAAGPSQSRVGTPLFSYAVIAGGLLFAVVSLPWLRACLPVVEERRGYEMAAETPVGAAQLLCTMADQGPLFNDIGYGSYLTWACPTVPIFMDTRFELYPDEMWNDYLVVAQARYGWEAVLERYGIETILAHQKNQRELIRAASDSGSWRIAYTDAYSALLRRTGP